MQRPWARTRARRFSRFWTREIGLLDEGLLDTSHSLTEARVIYELGQVPETTATVLAQALALDAGHLSRVLATLGASGIVARRRSPDDGRRQILSLTAAGRAAFGELDRRSAAQAAALLERLPPDAQARLLGAMAVIEELLGDGEPPSLVLRQPLPGEYGWVIQRHGALYAREHGFDTSFEALVAKIVAEFAHTTIPRASARGSPRSTATPWARSSASTPARASRSCACSWSSPPHAVAASASSSSTSASASPAPSATAS